MCTVTVSHYLHVTINFRKSIYILLHILECYRKVLVRHVIHAKNLLWVEVHQESDAVRATPTRQIQHYWALREERL